MFKRYNFYIATPSCRISANFSEDHYTSFRTIAGKSSKNAKAKNTKKAADKGANPKKKSGFTIPRNNPLLNGDSEDESIGTELPFNNTNVAKFSSNVKPIVKTLMKVNK